MSYRVIYPWAALFAALLCLPQLAQARPKQGDVRLMLETDVLRWTKVHYERELGDQDITTLSLGPFGAAEGASAGLASGGIGVAVRRNLVLNAAFGVSRVSNPDDDSSLMAMRLLPDLDILFGKGHFAPYIVVGAPFALGVLKAGGATRKRRAAGPQVGFGLLVGPFHAEATFGVLFGRERFEGAHDSDPLRELTFALSMGASLWR